MLRQQSMRLCQFRHGMWTGQWHLRGPRSSVRTFTDKYSPRKSASIWSADLIYVSCTAAQTETLNATALIHVATTVYAEELGPIVTPQAIVSVSPSTTAAVANPAPAEVRTHYAQTTINATLPISAWNVDRTVALAGAEEQRTYIYKGTTSYTSPFLT